MTIHAEPPAEVAKGGTVAVPVTPIEQTQPLVTLILTYTRGKVSRGEWWGDTVRTYRRHLWSFAAWCPNPLVNDPRRIRRHHVQAWVDANPAHSPGYRRSRLSALRGLFRWLHGDGRIPMDPTIGVTVPDIPDSAPRAFTDQEVDQLFAAVIDRRELVCLSLCWNEGLRSVEVARALIDDLNLQSRVMAVRGKFYRGKVSRTVAVSPESLDAITAYLRQEDARGTGPLIRSLTRHGAPLGAAAIRLIVAKVIDRAGLKRYPWDGRSSHAGRHTSATQALEAGARPEHMKRQYGWRSDAMIDRYGKAAALDLHEIHELRAIRRANLREQGWL